MTIYEYTRASVDHPERDEDATLVFTAPDRASVFAMIDGMGGHQHQAQDGSMVTGREAAQLLRTTLLEDLQHLAPSIDATPGGEAERKIIAALLRGNQRIRMELNGGDQRPLHERVGAVATVTVVCESGKRLLTVQVGDTRGYLFTEGELIQLIPDEDNVEYLVKQGLMTAEDGARVTEILNTFDGVHEPEADGTVMIGGNPYELYIAWRWFLVGNTVLNIPAANIVMSALGVHSVDPTPQTSRIEVSPGDALFMCSDGLYKNLSDAEIIAGLDRQTDSATVLGEMALARSEDRENRRSTQDDISVVLAWL